MDEQQTCADDTAFSETVFAIPSYLFERIKLCNYEKEIQDTLKDMFEGSKNVNDKILTFVVIDYDTFFSFVVNLWHLQQIVADSW